MCVFAASADAVCAVGLTDGCSVSLRVCVCASDIELVLWDNRFGDAGVVGLASALQVCGHMG
jgi:hypothetical protein